MSSQEEQEEGPGGQQNAETDPEAPGLAVVARLHQCSPGSQVSNYCRSMITYRNLLGFHNRRSCGVNNKGRTAPCEVVGQKVLIRQQPPGPPEEPEILLLTDQMMEKFATDDKYIKALVMIGYGLQDFTNDIRDSAIDVKFPYVLVFLRTLQLAHFDSRRIHRQVTDFMTVLNQITPNTLVLFSGLVPRPVDHPSSKIRCENYTRAYQLATQELCRDRGWNCTTVAVFA